MIRKLSFVSAANKSFNLAIVLGLMSLVVGCASGSKTETPATPAVPFNAMVIRHTVADYEKWRPYFDADTCFRDAAGLHLIAVGRGLQNPNELELPFVADNVAKAEAFTADPRLANVMQQAGVTSTPTFQFIKVIRLSEAGQQASLGKYVSVTQHVKDFDAWLKVFDQEGAATRAKDGLTDAVLAHGINDPNMIFLVFKINSIEEVNAAIASPARQQVMKDAGVVGKTEVYFGTDK